MSKGNIAIIPARGGSKRIPGKNIREFLGKPIISYSIENAIRSELFNDVIVSTNDPEIAELAIKYGADVPFLRSVENSDDFATTSEVLLEVINDYEKLGKSFSNGCCIYPTAPFAHSDLIKEGLDTMLKGNYNCMFPVVAYSHPVWRSFRIKDKRLEMIWPENKETRTQDMEEVYHDAGQFYWFRSDVIAREKQLIVANAGSIILPEDAVHDIDSDIDWKIAEIKYSLLNDKR